MKFFEDHLKSRFKNASSLDGIDADGLWNDIEASITEDDKKPPFFRRPGFLAIAFLFLLSVSGITWSLLHTSTLAQNDIDLERSTSSMKEPSLKQQETNSKDNSTTISQPTAKESITQGNNVVQHNTEKQTSQAVDVAKINQETTKQKTNNDSKELPKSKEEVSRAQVKTNNQTTTNSTVSNEKERLEAIKTQSDLTNKASDKEHNEIENNSIGVTSRSQDDQNQSSQLGRTNSSKEQNQSNNQTRLSEPIETIKNPTTQNTTTAQSNTRILPLFKLQRNNIPNFDLDDRLSLSNSIRVIKISEEYSKFRLGIILRGHTAKRNFTSIQASDNEYAATLTDGYDLELGFSVGLESSYYFTKNMFFSTGITISQSRSEFNYMETRDTTIVNRFSPVGSETGATITRTVKHHNQINYVSVPLLIGAQQTNGRFEYGASIGVGLNFTLSQKGRTLDPNQKVVFFPNSDIAAVPTPDFILSYSAQPFLNYSLNNAVSLRFRADVQYQMNIQSDFYNLKQSTLLIGGAVGLQHKF